MGKLEGKVALITGGAGNLGKTAAEVFLREGAKIALVDMDKAKLEEIKEELSNDHVLIVEANVRAKTM